MTLSFFLLTQIIRVNVCDFYSFDLDGDQQISETEMSTFIEMTGFQDLDEFFEKLDVNQGNIEYIN